MSQYIELPTMDVRNWLAGAARECGYPTDEANALGWTAWWLENRGCKGVLHASVYLLGIHGTPYDQLLQRAQGDDVVALCPIAMATLLTAAHWQKAFDFSDWAHGLQTAHPMMAAAALTKLLDYEYNVHLRYLDTHVILGEEGVAILSESLATFGVVDASGIEIAIRLVKRAEEAVDFTFTYAKHETLRVPAYRYLEGGGFRFD